MEHLPTKTLVIGLVLNEQPRFDDKGILLNDDAAVLMRWKKERFKPYEETGYLPGAELTEDKTPNECIEDAVFALAGIRVTALKEIARDTEIKADHDGVTKLFNYIDILCTYVSGEIQQPAADSELRAVGWAKVKNMDRYNANPPSRVLFEKAFGKTNPRSEYLANRQTSYMHV